LAKLKTIASNLLKQLRLKIPKIESHENPFLCYREKIYLCSSLHKGWTWRKTWYKPVRGWAR